MLEKQEGWGQLNVNYVGNKSIINTFFNSLSKKLKGDMCTVGLKQKCLNFSTKIFNVRKSKIWLL